jgi:hypothetical protein
MTRPEPASMTTSSSPLGPERRSRMRLPSIMAESIRSLGAATVGL